MCWILKALKDVVYTPRFASRFVYCDFQKFPLDFTEVCSVLTIESKDSIFGLWKFQHVDVAIFVSRKKQAA